MAIINPTWILNMGMGTPGLLRGSGAPAAEVYPLGTIYFRTDTLAHYLSDGAGTWTRLLDASSAIPSHPATATSSAGTGATGSDGTGATGGTAPAFSSAPMAETAHKTGTGFATVGQVTTTSDNQTMGLNECAGMWLITATHAPCLIVSNTAVVAAPAVLTVFGAAPATTAEDYQILKAPGGSVAGHTHTGPAHTHTGPAHTHDTPVLAHTVTP